MRDNSKLLAGIIIGAAAGTALTLLFNTEAGKEALAHIRSAAEKALERWNNAAEEGEQAETAV